MTPTIICLQDSAHARWPTVLVFASGSSKRDYRMDHNQHSSSNSVASRLHSSSTTQYAVICTSARDLASRCISMDCSELQRVCKRSLMLLLMDKHHCAYPLAAHPLTSNHLLRVVVCHLNTICCITTWCMRADGQTCKIVQYTTRGHLYSASSRRRL